MNKKIILIIGVVVLVVVGVISMLVINRLSNGDTNNIGEEATISSLEYPTKDYLSEMAESVTFSDGEEILITKSGTYEFSGDYTTSTITVNVDKNSDEGIVYLVLNEANINSQDSTPINIIEAKDVVIVLEGHNTVTQGSISTTDEEFPSAAIYSKADTVIIGDGSLDVTTLYNDGINSRDDLIIEGATIAVEAVEDGIVGKDFLAIKEADIEITAGKDGLKASNADEADKGNVLIVSGDFDILAQNDGISSEQILQIDDGSYNIKSGGGFVEVLNDITPGEGSGNTIQPSSQLEYSMKGLKGLNIILNGGDYIISSYEDAVHADENLTVNGGAYNIITGDDALHAEIDLKINDIDLIVEDGYEGIEGSTITINGGDISINVLDDAMNASSDSGYILITDGNIYLACQGDGIDSNGDLYIEGGEIVINVNSIYSGGDSELDVSGEYSITGGSVTDAMGNDVDVNQMGGMGGGPNTKPGFR